MNCSSMIRFFGYMLAVSATVAVFGCEAENIILGQQPPDTGGDIIDDSTEDVLPDITEDTDAVTDIDGDLDTTPDTGTGGECDLTGTWAIRVWTINVALGVPACSNNYYYLEIEDNGDTFTATRGASCTFEVVRGASVRLADFTQEALLRRSEDSLIAADSSIPADFNNSQTGRSGTFKPDGKGGCEFSIDRWWLVRGADLASYLPAKSDYATATVANPLATNPLPNQQKPAGNEDWDNDSAPGISLATSSPAEGNRYVSQRDYNEVALMSISGDTDRFNVRLQFNNAEGLLGTSPGAEILNQASLAAEPGDNLGHVMTWERLTDKMPSGEANVDAMLTYCQEEVEGLLQTRSRELTNSDFRCCELPSKVDDGSAAGYPNECKLSR